MDDLEDLVLDFQRDYAQSVVDEMAEVPMDMDWLFADASAPIIDLPGEKKNPNFEGLVVANGLLLWENKAFNQLRMVQMMTEPSKYLGIFLIRAQCWTTMSSTSTGVI